MRSSTDGSTSLTEQIPSLDTYRTYSARLFDVLDTGDNWVEFWASPQDRRRVTYAELARDARATAVRLERLGLRPGDVAVLAFEPGLDFLRGLLGVFHAGLVAAPVPLPTSAAAHATHRLEAIVADAGSTLVLCDESGARLAQDTPFDADVALEVLPPLADRPDAASGDAWRRPDVAPDDLAILQYTSGSTGSPKGVEITQANLVANQVALTPLANASEDMVLCGWLPHYHDMGLIGQLLLPFASCAALVFTTPGQFLRRPAIWLRMAAETRATMLVAPDFAYDLVAKLVRPEQVADLDLSALECVVTGSEPARPETMEAFATLVARAGAHPAFRDGYGMAESTLLVTGDLTDGPMPVLRVRTDALAAGRLEVAAPEADDADVSLLVSCGEPGPGVDVRIVDPASSTERPEGSVGEIWVSSPSVARGYRGRERGADDFAATLSGGDGTEYYRTGDLGALAGGRLHVTGRLKDLIIVRGRNVYPQDLEHELAGRAGSRGSGIAAAFETPAGVVAVVEATGRALADEGGALHEELHQAAADFLGTSAVTVHLVRRGAVPRTTSGKVQRSRTRELLEAGDLTPAPVPGAAR